MTLSSGTRLGPYEITSPLGAGGMGEVYRAKDTRLERSVALKVLPVHLSADAELKARMTREARAISALNHPHICALYDIGSEDGLDYLVMELLEGESLAERLTRGPLTTEAVLRYGIEISEALDKAHRQGIVHRDLKPGNVMLTKSGVKLLDFGLAKLRDASGADPVVSSLPTRLASKPLTEKGTVLGTFQYMSPEQLEGKDVDTRSDIFALGAVLYEMSTGRRAFSGTSQASLIAAILEKEPPPISTIQKMSPPALDRLVKTCLAKDPDERWQSAHDVAEQLRWIAEGGSSAGAPAVVVSKRRSRERIAWTTAAAALLALVLLAALRPFARPAPPLRLAIDVPPKAPYAAATAMAPSPDGGRVAFVGASAGRRALYVRPLSSNAAREVAGTEGGWYPFWSPDGRSLGFFADGKLKRIELDGGPARALADARDPWGGTWGKDDEILFCPDTLEAIWKVPASGGTPSRVTTLGPNEEAHRFPAFLPDGRRFVFMADSSTTEHHTIRLGSLDSPEAPILVQVVSNAAFAAPDILLYVRAHTLLAQRVDLRAKRTRGEPVAVGEEVAAIAEKHLYGFAVGGDTLVYQSSSPDRRLTFLDRAGHPLGDVGEPGPWRDFALAPDMKKVVAMRFDENARPGNLWMLDLARGSLQRLTTAVGGDAAPVFSPDGSLVLFMSLRGGRQGDLYTIPADGGVERLVAVTPDEKEATSVSPDGKTALVTVESSGANRDIHLLDIASGKLTPFVVTPFSESQGAFSPDGRFVAYVSNESGRAEVYVRPLGGGPRVQVSTKGGDLPRWRRDGRELYFLTGQSLAAADVKTSPRLEADEPKALFPTPLVFSYDVAPDGQRFLFLVPAEQSATPRTNVALGWKAALRR